MVKEWSVLPEDVQLVLAQQALALATERVAEQAEALAGVMEDGGLRDRGGPDALRLLAAVVRAVVPGDSVGGCVGRA